MAQRSWGEALSKLFKKDVPTAEAEKLEQYLQLARRCLKNVERKSSRSASSPLQINHGQCQYLTDKLRQALSEAETSWANPRSSKQWVDGSGVEIMKLLWRCAREVESFIEGSHRNNWVQAAIVSANMTEYVCQLNADLELCMVLISRHRIESSHWKRFKTSDSDFAFLRAYRYSPDLSAAVKGIASHDLKILLTKLETVNTSGNSSNEESQLAQCLASRLSHHSSGSVELDCREIQLSSLVPGPRLGSGSAGVTVRKSKWMGEEVAEKVFQGADHASFRNEVQILAGLSHPRIVPLIGYAEDRNGCIMVMELMDGDLSGFMQDRLRQNYTLEAPFSDFEAVDMMSQTAEGMRYLHEKRVVHRDLKALNILVKRGKDIKGEDVVYAAKIADFGLSKTRESSSSYSSLTANTGTTRWMAPELLRRGEDDVGARTSDKESELRHPFKVDVYSFGMVCYEILTGQVPFWSISSLGEVKKMVLRGERPEVPERCHELLKRLMRSCWETDPSCRPCFEEICGKLRRVKFRTLLDVDELLKTCSPSTMQVEFLYEELAEATNNFNLSNWIGRGAYSTVYYGYVRNQKLTIKRLELQYTKEFLTELQVLSNVHHASLVQLVGYCVTTNALILVFEYMENGTLGDHLRGRHSDGAAALSWRKRVEISLDAARGLEYIHEHSKPTYIHRDINPGTILLDSNFRAKVGDFNLAILAEDGFSGAIAGTVFYIAPEYACDGVASPKVDVYAFGMVLFEIISGRKPFILEDRATSSTGDSDSSPAGCSFAPILNAADGMTQLPRYIDPALKNDYPLDAVWKMAQLAGRCTHRSPDLRPTMRLVVMELMTLASTTQECEDVDYLS